MLFDDVFLERLSQRLLPLLPSLSSTDALKPDWLPDRPFTQSPVPAAVLIAQVRRMEGRAILYTERSLDLLEHSGQVTFPGGKVEEADSDAARAALREAFEEVGMDRADAQVIGFMPPYYTGTNYLITPVVAVVEPSGLFVPDPAEVYSLFEVPLWHILDV